MSELAKDPINDFSIMLGGPLQRIFVASRLATPDLGLKGRRIAALTMIAWLPLVVFAAAEGRLTAGTIQLPLLYDLEAHIRLLVVIPVLLLSEAVLHLRLKSVVIQFVERGIVGEVDLPQFRSYLRSLRRCSESKTVELALFIAVLAVGYFLWTKYLILGGSTAGAWYVDQEADAARLTVAGRWYVFVSIPIVQFLVCRLYYRVLLWFRFLWQVSRFRLLLNPVHGDGVGGLGFLGDSCQAFGMLLVANSSLFAAMLLTRILHSGYVLSDFKAALAFLVLAPVVVVLAPLLAFSVQLTQARWRGSRNYGLLMSEYAQAFDGKWFATPSQPRTELLGSEDIEVLSSMVDSYRTASAMRVFPPSRSALTRLLLASALPYVPLALTVVPLEVLAKELMTLVL